MAKDDIIDENILEEDNKKRYQGIMGFLNSRVGVWLLGVIFLSLLPYIIKVTSLSYKQEDLRWTKEQELGVEIAHRVRYIEALDRPVTLGQLNDGLFAYYGLNDSLVKLRHWQYYNFEPIYDDFEKVSIINLIVEYAYLQKDKTFKSETMHVAHLLEDMKIRYMMGDFNDALVKIGNSPYFDLRVMDPDTSLLRIKFITPLVDWRRETNTD